jgi:hypothetical protein
VNRESADALTAFLRARLDEDEARALAASDEWDDEFVLYEWEDLPDAVWGGPGYLWRHRLRIKAAGRWLTPNRRG